MEIIITTILAFAATNIDDLFLLTLFFGNVRYKPSHIVVGQLLGIVALIALSLGGSLIGELIKPSYVSWLGLFPIYLGVKQYIKLFRGKDDDAAQPELKSGNMAIAISLVTIANGGDNIGVYIPLFVALTFFHKIIMIVIFLLMTLLWCFAARYLSQHAFLKKALDQYGHIVTPAVLILLGAYIVIA